MEEKLQKAASLMRYLESIKKNGTVTFENDDKTVLKELYLSIYGSVAMDMSCSSCIIHYLHMLQAWYDRELKRFTATVTAVPETIEEVVIEKRIRKTRKK